MKLFTILASTMLVANAADDQDTLTISAKEKQKVAHLKKNWPKMTTEFFRNPANDGTAKRPVGAHRFADRMDRHMAKWHEEMVDTWHRCGRASMDPDFLRMDDERFNHNDPFKGMTQLTNQYKKWIEFQIYNGCTKQADSENYVSILTTRKYQCLKLYSVEPNQVVRSSSPIQILSLRQRHQ